MEQMVKIQINSDITDVTGITAITLQQTLSQLEDVRKFILQVKLQLTDADITDEKDREKLKKTLDLLDKTKVLLNKVDMRLADVASITSGLVSVFDKETQVTEPPVRTDNDFSTR